MCLKPNIINNELREMGLIPFVDECYLTDMRKALYQRSQCLKLEKILVLDDDECFVSMIFPPLLLSAASAYFLYAQGKSNEDILKIILDKKSSIVLLNGKLNGAQRGWNFIHDIKETFPETLCIGYSSTNYFQKDFLEAGADAFINSHSELLKQPLDSYFIESLALIVKEKRAQ